jgi:hypothetical protein
MTDAQIDPIEFIASWLKYFYTNFTRNAVALWSDTTAKQWIRVIVIVGAYLLLRPYLEKLGAKMQSLQHEKELDPAEMGGAAISANQLRGGKLKSAKGVPVELKDSDEEAEAEGTGANWGKKARKRQRQQIKKVLEHDEKLRLEAQGDEDDKDIMEYLVDYEEGEEGW